MKWVILAMLVVIVLLAVGTLSACTSPTKHSSRQLTCIGFCAETEVKHETKKPEDVQPKKEVP